MKPECLPVARELFTQWRRARGDRSEVSTRPFSRNWEELLSAAAIVAADDRAAAERDIRALASAGWVALKSVRYKAHFLDRVTIPLDQESRWKEAFGFVPPTDEETRLIQAYPWQAEDYELRPKP